MVKEERKYSNMKFSFTVNLFRNTSTIRFYERRLDNLTQITSENRKEE
jgi:hypothetical protein